MSKRPRGGGEAGGHREGAGGGRQRRHVGSGLREAPPGPGTPRRRTGPPGSQKAHHRPTMWGSLEDLGPREAKTRGRQGWAAHQGDPPHPPEAGKRGGWRPGQGAGLLGSPVRRADWPCASSMPSQFSTDCHVLVAQGLQVALGVGTIPSPSRMRKQGSWGEPPAQGHTAPGSKARSVRLQRAHCAQKQDVLRVTMPLRASPVTWGQVGLSQA